MVIARPRPDGGFDVVTREKETVRLGSGAADIDRLEPDAIDRGVETLKRFRRLADSHGASVAAVATSAVREAANRDEFTSRVRAETGIRVDVIPGAEEARLIQLGVLQAVPVFDRLSLIIDIGGGSTELVVGQYGENHVVRSVRVGAIRMTERFFPGGVSSPNHEAAARQWLDSFLAPTVADIRSVGFDVTVGSSGTIAALATMAAGRSVLTVNNLVLSRVALGGVVERLVAAGTPTERARIAGLDPRRADIIVGGAVLLDQLFGLLGIDELIVSEYALREGVLLDRMRPASGDPFHHLDDIRRRSVLRMAVVFEEDQRHVQHATDLALELFDDLAECHGLGLWERDLLEAAGLLHNIGLFVSHVAHHKHSYYLIRNSDRLVGFNDGEIELIAQIARYHRRSEPKTSHSEFGALDDHDQRRVRVLAGLLRIGIALDRRSDQRVQAVHASHDSGLVTIRVDAATDPSLEVFSVGDRSDLLAHALARRVVVESRGSSGSATNDSTAPGSEIVRR